MVEQDSVRLVDLDSALLTTVLADFIQDHISSYANMAALFCKMNDWTKGQSSLLPNGFLALQKAVGRACDALWEPLGFHMCTVASQEHILDGWVDKGLSFDVVHLYF